MIRASHFAGVAAVIALAGCVHLQRADKMRQFVNPDVNPSDIKTITIIAGGGSKANLGIMVRARDRVVKAGVPVVKRSGEWESDIAALKAICETPKGPDSVDGVVITEWDRLTLHECKEGKIALNVSGGYVGIDAMVDRLLKYMGK
jgi:hypothetical protein